MVYSFVLSIKNLCTFSCHLSLKTCILEIFSGFSKTLVQFFVCFKILLKDCLHLVCYTAVFRILLDFHRYCSVFYELMSNIIQNIINIFLNAPVLLLFFRQLATTWKYSSF